MPLLIYDLELDQSADSKSYKWTLYPPGTPQPVPPGATPVDLTGATARLMIRSHPADATPVVSLTTTLTAQGQLTLGGALGTVSLNITKAATALLTSSVRGALKSRYRHQLFVDFPDGTTLPLLSGNVNVELAVTH